jgi:hypothetical protein
VVAVSLRRSFIILALTIAAAVPSAAWSQIGDHPRLQDELDITDHRIEIATTLLGETPSARAQLELTAAVDLQRSARSAFLANQLALALTATLNARTHADRAISIIRGLPDPDHVSAQVERTRDIVDRARERIDGCDDTRARALVRVAIEMQARAERAVSQGHYLGALQLTVSARERVQRALRLCHMDDSVADTAERALQRTDELISRAQERIDSTSPAAARDMLARAVSVQGQARAEARLERYDSALRMTQSARTLLRRAMGFGPTPGRSPH